MIDLTPELATFITRVYEQACHIEVEDFKPWLYDEINRLIPLDAGIWFSRSDMQKPMSEYWQEDTFLFNLPDDFMSNYHHVVTHSHEIDLFHELILRSPNKTCIIADAYGSKQQWQETTYYIKHCALFDVEDVLSVLATADQNRSQTVHVISLYRKNKDLHFSKHERQLFQFIYPQLVEAFRINLFCNINEDFDHNKPIGLLAIMDRLGHILDADRDFNQLLNFDADFTYDSLQKLVKNSTGVRRHTTKKFNISIDFHSGLFFINIKPIDLFGELNKQQLKICQYLQQGYSDEDIGEALNISRRRVRYLLDKIFTKLQITNRNKLFILLNRFGLKQ